MEVEVKAAFASIKIDNALLKMLVCSRTEVPQVLLIITRLFNHMLAGTAGDSMDCSKTSPLQETQWQYPPLCHGRCVVENVAEDRRLCLCRLFSLV